MPVAAGQSISHYRLVEQIGAGGMGVVWKAIDTTLDRVVAVKLLAENRLCDPAKVALFKREALAIAALNHPNIVQIYSVDEADGIPFLTMEFVRGRTLASSIPRGGLPLGRFFELAVPLADALHASHERDIVHRDLKPGNIMVGDDGRARIVDFGLAQLRAPRPADLATATSTASGAEIGGGTLPYMAPEQLQGKPPDPRSDIFSLGVVLYEMATGERPFRADNTADLIAAILNSEPAPVTRLNPSVPRELERIVEHSIRKDRRRRFQTALDVRNELEELRRELQTTDPTAGAAAAVRRPPVAFDVRSIAVLPLRNLGSDPDSAYFCDGLTEELISTLAQTRSLRVVSRTSAFAVKELGLGAQEIGRRLGVGAVIEGSVRSADRRLRVSVRLVETAGGYHLWAATYDRELRDVFTLQDEISQSVAQELRVSLEAGFSRSRRYTDNLDVYQLYLKGRHYWHLESAEALEQAIGYFRQALAKDAEYAPAHAGVADYYVMLAFWGIVKPSEAWPEARAAAQRAVELDPELPEAHVSLGLVALYFDWDAAAADREFLRALELHPGLSDAHYARTLVLTQVGDTTGALEEIGKARSLDPLSPILRSTEAWVHYYARRYDEAIAGCRRTLERHPGFLEAQIGLGVAMKEAGLGDAALRELERARDLSDANPLVLGVLGAALAEAGRGAEALALAQQLEQRQEGYVAPIAHAMIYCGLGDEQRALEWLRRSLDAKDGLARYLGVFPLFDPVRAAPGFAELLAALNLEAANLPNQEVIDASQGQRRTTDESRYPEAGRGAVAERSGSDR